MAVTSLGDVPVPLNNRIGAPVFDFVRAQPVSESNAKHETYRQLLILMTIMPSRL
jgi:hypothetical protein